MKIENLTVGAFYDNRDGVASKIISQISQSLETTTSLDEWLSCGLREDPPLGTHTIELANSMLSDAERDWENNTRYFSDTNEKEYYRRDGAVVIVSTAPSVRVLTLQDAAARMVEDLRRAMRQEAAEDGDQG